MDLVFKNFRPATNLVFISELIEHCVGQQIADHCLNTSNKEPLQFAYREEHSTETGFLKVYDEILNKMDKQEITCLLLDLSAIFDTLEYKIFIDEMLHHFEIQDIIL